LGVIRAPGGGAAAGEGSPGGAAAPGRKQLGRHSRARRRRRGRRGEPRRRDRPRAKTARAPLGSARAIILTLTRQSFKFWRPRPGAPQKAVFPPAGRAAALEARLEADLGAQEALWVPGGGLWGSGQGGRAPSWGGPGQGGPPWGFLATGPKGKGESRAGGRPGHQSFWRQGGGPAGCWEAGEAAGGPKKPQTAQRSHNRLKKRKEAAGRPKKHAGLAGAGPSRRLRPRAPQPAPTRRLARAAASPGLQASSKRRMGARARSGAEKPVWARAPAVPAESNVGRGPAFAKV
jgi:hypothetical protein